MQKLTGAGAATNAGIEYQQRVSAWFLMGLLLDIELPTGVEELKEKKVTEVAFETTNPIDDLKISFSSDLQLFAQIKRTLDFSTSPVSDFYKTLHQFVSQFLYNPKQYFVLITSPKSSSKVIRVWKKILESIRLNDGNFEENPLSQIEKETFDEYSNILKSIFSGITGKDLKKDIFVQLSKRIYTLSLDIEADMPQEQTAIMILNDKCNINAYLIWNALITSSLHMAKNRFSINKEGCLSKFGRFLKKEGQVAEEADINALKVIQSDNISSGREVLMLSGEKFGTDYLITELFRFNDDCSKRGTFESPDKYFWINGDETKLIYRSATFIGMERFLKINENLYKDKEITIIPANDIDDIDETPCVKAYQDYCNGLLAKNKNLQLCVHCGKVVSDPESTLIEIDDALMVAAIGITHDECKRPVDRVLGVMKNEFFAEYPYLKNFDASIWKELIVNGQFVFRILDSGIVGRRSVHNVMWSPDDEKDEESEYCIKTNLSDGSFEYVSKRGKVEKFSKLKAEQGAQDFNSSFEKAKSMHNPWGYTSKNKSYGMRSVLLQNKEIDEHFIECISAEPVRYNKSIGKLYNEATGYYTPICFLVNRITGDPFSIHGHVVLLTEPVKLNHYLENWKEAKIETINDYELRIIKQDADFDIKARQFTSLGYALVANPILDENQNLVSGVIILSEEQLEASQNHQN